MTVVTLEWIYDNGIIKSVEKIKDKPNKIYIVLDYDDAQAHQNIDLHGLVGIIQNDFSHDYQEALVSKYQ